MYFVLQSAILYVLAIKKNYMEYDLKTKHDRLGTQKPIEVLLDSVAFIACMLVLLAFMIIY